jgi:hypothetical protein
LEFPGQLPISHIDGIDFPCPLLKNTIGKPAGGGSHIHDHPSGRIDAKSLQRLLQFQSASTHIRQLFSSNLDPSAGFHPCPGFIDLLAADQNLSFHDQGSRPFTA